MKKVYIQTENVNFLKIGLWFFWGGLSLCAMWKAMHSTLNFTTLFAQLYSVVPFSLSAVDNQVTVEYIYYREKIPQMRNTLRHRLLFSFLSFHFSDQCGVLAQCAE